MSDALELDKLINKERKNLERTFATKHATLQATTEVFKNALFNAKNKGWKTHAALWNAGIYVNLAAHDLSVLVEQLAFERDVWARRLIARHVALLVYEITEDLRELLGKRLRDPLATLGLLATYDVSLRRAREPLDRFWDQKRSELQRVRVTTAAHRDLDGLAILETVEAIDVHHMIKVGMDLGQILNEIGAMLQKILTASSNIAPPELSPVGH
jgi:hypothetical protein